MNYCFSARLSTCIVP